MSNARPKNNIERMLQYDADPFTDFTPRQLRRFRKHHNRRMGANGSGKVTPRQVVTRKAKRCG